MRDPKYTTKSATHYLPNERGGVALYYRVNQVTFNTGETGTGLCYYSPDFECWRGTNERDIESFIANRLVPVSAKGGI